MCVHTDIYSLIWCTYRHLFTDLVYVCTYRHLFTDLVYVCTYRHLFTDLVYVYIQTFVH